MHRYRFFERGQVLPAELDALDTYTLDNNKILRFKFLLHLFKLLSGH